METTRKSELAAEGSRFVQKVPAVNNVDLSLFKNTAITEGTKIQVRVDLINAFNRPWLLSGGAIQMNPTANNFGQVTAGNQANYARRVQLMLKFIF